MTDALDFGVAAAVLLAGAAALPLGMAGPDSVAVTAAGYTLGAGDPGSGQGPMSPLAVLAVRVFACLPLGDLATRANLACAVLAAVAATLLARLAAEALAALREGGAPGRGRDVQAGHEIAAAAAGALIPLLSLNVFLSVTTATTAAVTLVVVSAGWLRAARLLRHPGQVRDGLTLAFLSGLGLAADPLAFWLLAPLAVGCWFRSLRRGERWPLLAPMLATGGAALALFATVTVPMMGPPGVLAAVRGVLDGAGRTLELGLAREGLGTLSGFPSQWWLLSPTDDLVAELGVVAGLVALDGFVTLTRRAPVAAGLTLLSAGSAMAVYVSGGSRPAGAGAASWAMLLAATTVPLALGVAHLAGKLGQARAATATVVAIMALVSPALDGGSRRFTRPVALSEGLLREAHAELAPAMHIVDPGSATMRSLFHYGQSLGLRPDLAISYQRSAVSSRRLPMRGQLRRAATPLAANRAGAPEACSG